MREKLMRKYFNQIKEQINTYDDDTKRKITIGYFILMLFIIFYSLYGIYSAQKNAEENLIAVERSPLVTFRFLEYRETGDGAFVDIVNTENGKKYKDVFVSSSCPKGQEKKPGMLMKLYAVKYINFTTNENVFRFNRIYDYICTKKDMVKEDEILLKKIKDASEAYIQQLIQEAEVEEEKNRNKKN